MGFRIIEPLTCEHMKISKIWFLALFVGLGACQTPKVTVEHLRVEMQENPVGIGTTHPRFSWQLQASVADVVQSAYRIEVARSEKELQSGDLVWDSGRVADSLSVLIPYGGPSLESGSEYYWRVRVETNRGETPWSPVGRWSMALLDAQDWRAEWIGIAPEDSTMTFGGDTNRPWIRTRLSARYLRKEFSVEGEVSRAMLYICGLGAYDAYLNGERIGNAVLAPAQTNFAKTTYFNTYEVTAMLESGTNALGVVLGNQHYYSTRNPGIIGYGYPQLLAQLEVEYADGTRDTVVSDLSWQVTDRGPIVANNEFDGEEYDARLEMPGWNRAGYDASAWRKPDRMKAPTGQFCAQPNPPMVIHEELKPVSVKRLDDGRLIVDMGQNMVGWLRVRLQGKKDQPIQFRFAELLTPDGNLYMDNLRGALVTDIYTPAIDGSFEWEPRFVYHGFRYVEISGLDELPEADSLTGCVIYDDMETTGTFETSNEVLNQVFRNAYWGIRGNYRSFPTDCPQRDERLGWLGDRTTGAYGEAFVFDNALMYNKWLQDIEDSQSPEGCISAVSPAYWEIYQDNVTWPAAYFTVADMLYRHFGDTSGIVRHYPSMKRFVDRIVSAAMEDDIVVKDRYGDWCMPPERQELIHSQDPARKTPGPILSTTVFYHLLELMSEYAVLSGNEADTTAYCELAARIKKAYNERYFDPQTARYGNNTVTGNVLSLRLGLVPEGYEERVARNIVDKTVGEFDGHVSTGVLGIQHLMRGLTESGHVDLAYRIATNDTYPSWGYMAKQGATTIWELWNGDTAAPDMNSCNHVMLLGDLLIWYYENLAGIRNDPSSIAFKRLRMTPVFPEGLEEVKASYRSPYGTIASHWTLHGNDFTWEIELPANTSARIEIPARFGVRSADQPGVRSLSQGETSTVIEIGSGRYRFVSAR